MPPFAYYGGKTTLAPAIAALLPGDTDRTEVLWSNRPIGTPDLFSFDAEASA